MYFDLFSFKKWLLSAHGNMTAGSLAEECLISKQKLDQSFDFFRNWGVLLSGQIVKNLTSKDLTKIRIFY